MVSVRPAQLSDAAAIARLTVQLGYDVHADVVASRLSRMLAGPDHLFLVAELDGNVVGSVHGVVHESLESVPSLVLGGMVVDRALRGKGVGGALVAKAEAWAVERGIPVVRLSTSAGRTEAHRFYEQLGYVNVKSQLMFVKAVDPAHDEDVTAFAPDLDR